MLERYKLYWALSILAGVVVTLAIVVVGSLCGDAHCKGRAKTLFPPAGRIPTNAACECTCTIGPLTSTADGGELAFQFVGLPDASGDVTVRIAYRGDINDPSEYATILGEGGAEIGIASSVECAETLEVEDFMVVQDTFNRWNKDLTVELDVELSVDVDAYCDNIIDSTKSVAKVSLTLLYDAPGGCP